MGTPKNGKEFYSFQGYVSYFSLIGKSLFELTKPSVAWNWSEECDMELYTLNDNLVISPILSYPDVNSPFFAWYPPPKLDLPLYPKPNPPFPPRYPRSNPPTPPYPNPIPPYPNPTPPYPNPTPPYPKPYPPYPNPTPPYPKPTPPYPNPTPPYPNPTPPYPKP
ncbi:nematocyst expressed protein 4-like [Mytilus trossulus]|uniref:nematocyst expressed protein 4-like n=1 Tax=Mytilus trossulus TaxID=6551 RepID=UPI00300723CB